MRKFSHRLICLAGMAAYAAFAFGLTGALHASLAHSDHHDLSHSADHLDFAPGHDHGQSEDSHGESHAPDCPTCYQLVSATNAALTLSILLPECGDTSSQTVVHLFQLAPATQVLSSIAPRAPPVA